jgi:hypothetical protein
MKRVNLTKSFSNAFSNADGYVRSRPNVSEVKRQYSNRQGSPVNISELKKTAWHAVCDFDLLAIHLFPDLLRAIDTVAVAVVDAENLGFECRVTLYELAG